jgi:hypothetical protein
MSSIKSLEEEWEELREEVNKNTYYVDQIERWAASDRVAELKHMMDRISVLYEREGVTYDMWERNFLSDNDASIFTTVFESYEAIRKHLSEIVESLESLYGLKTNKKLSNNDVNEVTA